ncbi:helix-turn-helix domain-containing protein [Actinokineospora sp. HUAS TT18]|uniref:helix-turn-helix domain-containing protein n=1 Tax=Actinokineospora sp. HUAS TT18 TaxID=3447451 RepID=UPI003F526E44
MTSADPRAVGRKVAFHRGRCGFSQKELAARLSRSESWVSQVERGVRRIDRMSVLETVAEVLGVPLAELTGADRAAHAVERPPAATALSLALSSSDALHAVLAEITPVAVERLGRGADRAWEFAHAARHEDLSKLLGTLIPELEYGTRKTSGAERKRLCTAKAKAYHSAAAVLSKLGETGAAWVAVDRAIRAAEDAEDPLLMAAGAFRLAILFQSDRRFDLVNRVASTAANAISRLVESGERAALSLTGALHLQLAVAAARSDDADSAYSHLAKAERMAKKLGTDGNDYDTEFGPTNVFLHEIGIAVELGDAGRALRVAGKTDATKLSIERRTQLLIEVATAHSQRRQTSLMVEVLARAHETAPEQVSASPVVAHLIEEALRDGGDIPELRRLAAELRTADQH